MQTPNECRTDNNSDDKNDGKSKANLNNKIDSSKLFKKSQKYQRLHIIHGILHLSFYHNIEHDDL